MVNPPKTILSIAHILATVAHIVANSIPIRRQRVGILVAWETVLSLAIEVAQHHASAVA